MCVTAPGFSRVAAARAEAAIEERRNRIVYERSST
jgi:hypothetical protein